MVFEHFSGLQFFTFKNLLCRIVDSQILFLFFLFEKMVCERLNTAWDLLGSAGPHICPDCVREGLNKFYFTCIANYNTVTERNQKYNV